MNKFLEFPPDFLWGASTAAYQIEGGWNEGGRGESIWDRFTHTPGNIANNDTGDSACDHYHRWRDDVDLMARLGLSAYRFSIAWPRVLPKGRGAPNAAGIDFYSRLIDYLLEKNIEPIVTLYHWDLPQAIQDAGGWLNRRTIDWFAEYAGLMFRTFGDRVTWWVSINEPMVCSELGFDKGNHAPGVRDRATALQVFHHILMAHGDAVAAARACASAIKIGIAPALIAAYPASDTTTDREAAQEAWAGANGYQLDPLFFGRYPEQIHHAHEQAGIQPVIISGDMDRIRRPIDFLGVNHYFSQFYTRDRNGSPVAVKHASVPAWSDLGWPVFPPGITDLLLRLKADYGPQPIFITENGISLNDSIAADGSVHDPRRTTFLKGFLEALHNAIKAGVDVRGYCHWSLMDNFEWAYGYGPRFGLTYIDYATQRRIIKESGYEYAAIIRAGGVPADGL
jgi:beta-glucosidase